MKIGAVFFLVCALFAFPEVTFSGLDLNAQNRLLFKAFVDVPGYGDYSTLLSADLSADTMQQLTYFPENVSLLRNSGSLQIQNRFGVFRSGVDMTSMTVISRFPAFVNGKQIQTGKIFPLSASPDGRYLLYVSGDSPAYGTLQLYDVVAEKETRISGGMELSTDGPSALWSPDSQFFIYSKSGQLFYFSVEQYRDDRLLSEKFRMIGPGRITNVKWGRDDQLFYIRGSLVYKILSAEFFTRSLYQDLLKIGRIIGKIPFVYDANFDDFWISPDGSKMILSKGGRNIFLYFLQVDDFRSTGETVSLPYLLLPHNSVIKELFWSRNDLLTILTGSIFEGRNAASLFRLDLSKEQEEYAFTELSGTRVRDIAVSPDEYRIAVLDGDNVIIRDYFTWEKETSYSHTGPLHVLWKDSSTVVVSGSYLTETINTDSGRRDLVCLSQVTDYGFSASDGSVQAKSSGNAYQYTNDGGWRSVAALNTAASSVSSGTYRVYLEQLSSGSYKNMVMVRKTKDIGTEALFPVPERKYEAFPDREETVDTSNFTHGSRIRRREVSLVFNAIDTVEGLTQILTTLSDYGIKTTFFVNGDFIQRNPGAVKEIADSGHEIGSLFHTYFNMADSRFKINEEYIKQGLGRNEDEYFEVTGKELSLLWHAPYYFTNSLIISASNAVNYSYIGRDVDSLDWVPKRGESGISRLYLPAADLVERIIDKKKPGSIISMRVGMPEDGGNSGGRDDYLFAKLDLLINELIARGYRIVPVSALMDRVH